MWNYFKISIINARPEMSNNFQDIRNLLGKHSRPANLNPSDMAPDTRLSTIHFRKFFLVCVCIVLLIFTSSHVWGQTSEEEIETLTEEEGAPEEEIFPIIEPSAPEEELPGVETPSTERIAGGEAREGETRWNIDITGAVVMNYVFNDLPNNFVVKYRWEIKGLANANTAVIKGDADINASVDGPLASGSWGECRLEITIPKVPFELTFNRNGEGRGNLKLIFKKAINEDWQSKCSFTEAPGARFNTKGAPEAWLAKALEKARPPLKDIVAEVGSEETSTRFVISKETINDAPIGSGEIEGTGVVTITPGS